MGAPAPHPAPSCSAHPRATPTDSTPRIVGIGVGVSTPIDDELITATIATIKADHDGPAVLGGVAIQSRAHAIALGGDIWTTSARDAVDRLDATT